MTAAIDYPDRKPRVSRRTLLEWVAAFSIGARVGSMVRILVATSPGSVARASDAVFRISTLYQECAHTCADIASGISDQAARQVATQLASNLIGQIQTLAARAGPGLTEEQILSLLNTTDATLVWPALRPRLPDLSESVLRAAMESLLAYTPSCYEVSDIRGAATNDQHAIVEMTRIACSDPVFASRFFAAIASASIDAVAQGDSIYLLEHAIFYALGAFEKSGTDPIPFLEWFFRAVGSNPKLSASLAQTFATSDPDTYAQLRGLAGFEIPFHIRSIVYREAWNYVFIQPTIDGLLGKELDSLRIWRHLKLYVNDADTTEPIPPEAREFLAIAGDCSESELRDPKSEVSIRLRRLVDGHEEARAGSNRAPLPIGWVRALVQNLNNNGVPFESPPPSIAPPSPMPLLESPAEDPLAHESGIRGDRVSIATERQGS